MGYSPRVTKSRISEEEEGVGGSRDELTSRMQSEEKQRRMRRKADEAGEEMWA